MEIESRSGSQAIAVPRYTRRASSFKDDEVPLRPGDSFTRHLPVQLNDLHAMPGEGWHPRPGAYRIRVRYDSDRSGQERSASVLRAVALSSWTDVHVLEPSKQQQIRVLRELESCIQGDECDAIEVANFYRVFRDKRAPDLLLRLLEKRPFDIWLLDAVVGQGRASDAPRLRALSAKVDDPSIRQRFIDSAIELERLVTHISD